jgi:hypothetical protein
MTALEMLAEDGLIILPPNERMIRWAEAAKTLSEAGLSALGPEQWRHQNSWCVGLELLPNDPDGGLPGGVPFASEGMKVALQRVDLEEADLHKAQV